METYGSANIELDFGAGYHERVRASAKSMDSILTPAPCERVADGHKQNIECSSTPIVDIMDEVERVTRWRSQPGGDPFGGLRDEREAHLNEVEKKAQAHA